jgi:hypothetical protein
MNMQRKLDKMIILKYIVLVTIILHSINALSNENIRVNKVVSESDQLVFSILKLALSKVDTAVIYQQNNEELNTARVIDAIESKKIDVMWSGTSTLYEERMRSIKIPVLKGLLGHRVFIIRSEDQEKFSSINSLEELKRLDAGLGTLWGDTKIMKLANIPTVTTIKYPNLFLMLEGSRFDYFPRALHEPWAEVKSRPELNLSIENNIMLIYPFALYFYVEKSNKALHKKIYNGFEIAISDGSFDALFFNNPMIKNTLEQANIKERKVFRIENSTIHPDTPFNRKEFWLDLDRL